MPKIDRKNEKRTYNSLARFLKYFFPPLLDLGDRTLLTSDFIHNWSLGYVPLHISLLWVIISSMPCFSILESTNLFICFIVSGFFWRVLANTLASGGSRLTEAIFSKQEFSVTESAKSLKANTHNRVLPDVISKSTYAETCLIRLYFDIFLNCDESRERLARDTRQNDEEEDRKEEQAKN